MAVVAVIGVMAMTGLSEVIHQQTLARERAARWQAIQLAMRVIVQDLSQLQPRPTRDELGEAFMPSLLADPNGQFALEFSRGGWSNPGGFPRGTVLRVAYNFEDDKLVRYHWPVMDRTTATPPVRTELLDGVDERRGALPRRLQHVAARLAARADGQGRSGLIERPRAVEFAIELKDFGRVSRLVETTG